MKSFFNFSVKFFWPYVIFLAPLILIFGLGGIVNLVIALSSQVFHATLRTGLSALSVTLLPFLIMAVCYFLRKKFKNNLHFGILLYISQIFIVFIPCYAILVAMGGTSMATADGLTSRVSYTTQLIYSGPYFFLLLNIFVVPWTVFSLRKYKKD